MKLFGGFAASLVAMTLGGEPPIIGSVNMDISGIVESLETSSESVYHAGFDGAKTEYCPYNETSKSYDQTRAPLGLNIVLGSMALHTPLAEQKLLDIGSGTGTFIERVHGHVKEMTGLEYNDGMIAQARNRLGNSSVKLVQGSADKMPFEDGSFNGATIHQVIHHFPKEDNYAFSKRVFAEAFRVLKPGGIFVVHTSTPEQQRDAFWWLSLFPKASDAICERFPPMDVLKDHLKAAGFSTNSDSVVVPLHRTLMAEDKYLEQGARSGFDASYRAGDSSWAMAENFGELDEGLQKLQAMLDAGTDDAWLQEREALRLSMGQATFITAYKQGTRDS